MSTQNQNQDQNPRQSEELNQQNTSASNTQGQQQNASSENTSESRSGSEELEGSELKETNGGFLGLGEDNSSLTAMTQGTVNLSHTDEDGQTESTNLDFGSGSLLNTTND